MRNYTTDDIKYYYPASMRLDKSRAKKLQAFIDTFRDDYNLPKPTQITYIMGNTISECSLFLGIKYSNNKAYDSFAGISIHPNILLSIIPDNIHEVTRTLLKVSYPDIPELISRGVATYYGGCLDVPYPGQMYLFKAFLHDNPEIDLSNFDRYNLKLIGSFNPFHIVGSMIVDEALKTGGKTKVLEILSYTSINDVFEKGLKIDRSEIGDFIKKKSKE